MKTEIMDGINYLLLVSGALAVFYSLYYLSLSRLTFYSANRFYLLTMLVLSFIVPLLTIPLHVPDHYTPIAQPATFIRALEKPALVGHHSPVDAAPAINWLQALKMIYVTVVAALLIQLAIALFSLFIKRKRRKITQLGRVCILRGNKRLSNGSFMNYIFLNDQGLTAEQARQVVAHEMMHIRLLHSIDRIAMKIAQVVLWFNPIIYLYARSMEENHEFEVDRKLTGSSNKKEYAGLLLHLSAASHGLLYNSFSKAPLKKRISMLFGPPSAKAKKLVYLLALPAVALSCIAFSKFRQNPIPAAGLTPGMAAPEIRKEIKMLFAAAKFDDSKFYSRVPLRGGFYDVVRININGETRVTVLPHNIKLAFVIEREVHDESEIAGFTQQQLQARYQQLQAVGASHPGGSGYGAVVEVGPGFNAAALTVKPNPASDALPPPLRGYGD